MMRKIKIAQIGTSEYSHGIFIWDSLVKQSNIFEIAGFCLPENEREKYPQKMRGFEGYTELTLDDILNNPEIEAVAIETEEKYLTKYALMAAEHGKHIHMEKPGGTVLSDFEKLIDIVKKNGTVFHTGYMYRYNPYITELIKGVKNGELGEIINVEAQMNCVHSKEQRDWLGEYKGGSTFFLGCHLIDLILQIMGTPDRIIPLNKSTGIGGTTSEDFGMAALEYKNGVSFAKVSSNEVGGFARRQLVVSGTKRTVELKPLEMYADGGLITVKTEYASADWGNKGETATCDVYDRYDTMMRSFAEMVCGEKKNPYSYDYELELYKTILKCCGVD